VGGGGVGRVTAEAMWDELQRRWYPGDPFTPDVLAKEYYVQKYQVAAQLQPASVCEIGVRAGYAAFAFLSAVPEAEYLGIDSGTADREARVDYTRHARGVLMGFGRTHLMAADSQRLTRLPFTSTGARFEFVHVDGGHTTEACLHDLRLAQQSGARWILVDDFDVPADDAGAGMIRAACRVFLLDHEGWTAEYLANPLVGSLLLRRT
jgi:hypothetical protein